MALSNTAVPKYYGIFRDQVLNGEIVVCETISLEMNRIDDLIENPNVYYDPAPVEGYISFCERELTLTDGSPLHLLETFKLWAEQIYGWYYFVERSVYVPNRNGVGGHYVNKRIKKRLINKQYLVVSRGNAKSLYDTTIQAYEQVTTPDAVHLITVAPTMKQAEEIMGPYRTAIQRHRGPVFSFLTLGKAPGASGGNVDAQAKLVATKKGIENATNGSLLEVRPMSIDKLQGLRPTVATIDEWLSGDVREDVVSAIEQGASKNENWLIVATSSEGTVRNSVGDTIKMELMSILKGEYNDPHTSIWYYRQDDIQEVGKPETWMKSNPNIGRTVTYDTLQRDVERAENAPATRNDILAKRFGIPMEGYTYFFTYEETLPHRRRDFWGMPCALGADLSLGDDFCSFTFLFPLADETFGVKSRNYISEYTLTHLTTAARTKYEQFIDEGSLHVMEGTVLDMEEIYDDLDRYIIESEYDVRAFGYDPYNAKSFVERWCKENSEFGVVKVIQGAKTESVPLGEIKKLAEERKLIFDEGLVSFTMGNCIVLEDTNGNRKLYKAKREDKIDAVSAMMDALVAFKQNRDAFE